MSLTSTQPISAARAGSLPAGDFLYMDAARREPFVGILRTGPEYAWVDTRHAGGQAATEGLFGLLAAVGATGARLESLAGFIFAEGPGSTLGIRIAAAVLRTWHALPVLNGKIIFAVNSLTLGAHLLLRAKPGLRDFSIIADSRQGWWNTVEVRGGHVPADFREFPASGLSTLPAPHFRVVQRPLFSSPPVETQLFPENALELDPAVLATPGLLRPTSAPDAANLPGAFVKWTPSGVAHSTPPDSTLSP
ncbi:MAG: hypothetical protein LBG65_03290 [Puniceicoccales bacterium]|jgi:hypothetical protein|nr:hypothetical protein [Puniceicoccales bacterium]